jgi:hypothetical protein
MTVRNSTFQIALVITIVVAILIIIYASWSLAQLNRTVGDSCTCSGVTDVELNNLKMMSVLILLVGIGILIYAVIMLLLPMGDRSVIVMDREGITERRARRSF